MYGKNFLEIWCLSFFRILTPNPLRQKIQVSFKSEKITGTLFEYLCTEYLCMERFFLKFDVWVFFSNSAPLPPPQKKLKFLLNPKK